MTDAQGEESLPRPPLPPLPIDPLLPSLVETLQKQPWALLQAPPGAGKTSRVPAALARSPIGEGGMILVLEPRRLAAKSAAKRLAEEEGWRLGEEVGYHVRFEPRFSKKTRILFATEGIGLRRLQDDPFLEGVAAVVFDEFHERHLDGDLVLAITRQIQAEIRPDLRLLVMSATLQGMASFEALEGCPRLESEGRQYPVEVRHLPMAPTLPLPQRAVAGCRAAWSQTPGDLLVFLPGVAEIRQTQSLLREEGGFLGAMIVGLYGEMSLEDQEAVLRPAEAGKRKIVCATNLAESSLTIEGITAVIDTGYLRQMRYDRGRDINRLEVVKISRASAVQRAGRAGRMQAGIAFRLWSEHEEGMLEGSDIPEIRRLDLSGAVLSLLAWGETEPLRLPWLEAPKKEAIESAFRLLRDLGAWDDQGLTAIGRRLALLPLPPRIGRMLLEGEALEILDEAAMIAVLLTERDPWGRGNDEPWKAATSLESDPYDRYLRIWQATRSEPQRVAGLVQIQRHLLSLLRTDGGHRERPLPPPEDWKAEALHRALLAAWPERVAQRRLPHKPQALLADGRGVCLRPSSAVKGAELFLALEFDPSLLTERSEAWVTQAAALEPSWLPQERIKSSTEALFDPGSERVSAVEIRRYGAILLSEKPVQKPDPTVLSALLAEAACSAITRVLPPEDDPFHAYRLRIDFLARECPEIGITAITDEEIRSWLPALCEGCRSFADLRRLPWLDTLRSKLTYPEEAVLKGEAPERFQVPSGSSIRLLYQAEGPPILAVKIQELFGMHDTPRIAKGRVPLLLHLLAPNGRPQQVTQDLRNFWKETYPQVRKELRQRYPKHAWPDDPWTAQAQKRPSRPS